MKRDYKFFILFVLLGFLLITFVSVINNNVKYVPLQDIEILVVENDKLQKEVEVLRSRKEEIDENIFILEVGLTEESDIEDFLASEIIKYKEISGLTDVFGPGVIIIVNDSERALLEDEDPNNLLVHDLDIVAIIEDLKLAGAEAIAVNGQRVLYNLTEVVCNGPTIRINDKVYSQPFIIEAIGSQEYLAAAVTAPNTYGNILKQWGLFIEVNTSIYLEIPKYSARANYEYLEIKE